MSAIETPLLFLKTERLRLRPFTESDHSLVLRIASDPGTTKYLFFWGRIGSTPETDARRYLEYALGRWMETPIRAWEYCVTLKATGETIGQGSVEWSQDIPGMAELGWILLPEYRGKGYATEMGRELLRAAFEVLGARTVIAHCDDRNAASYRVMERLGMKLDSVEKGARPAKRAGESNGDERTYALSRSEWNIQRAWAEYHTYTCHFKEFALCARLSFSNRGERPACGPRQSARRLPRFPALRRPDRVWRGRAISWSGLRRSSLPPAVPCHARPRHAHRSHYQRSRKRRFPPGLRKDRCALPVPNRRSKGS